MTSGGSLLVAPLDGPVDAVVRPPGSKSLTNRALVCAALAPGRSVLDGALFADDTEAMLGGVRALGARVEASPAEARVAVTGPAFAPAVPAGSAAGAGSGGSAASAGSGGSGAPAAPGVTAEVGGGVVGLDARMSGTTARFLLPVAALGPRAYRLDGAPSLRARPMADGIAALRALGVEVVEEGEAGRLPVLVRGRGGVGPPSAGGVPGEAGTPAEVSVPGDASSQFLSGLLLSGPGWPGGLRVTTPGRLVSRPYVDMTAAVMRAFGAEVRAERGGWAVGPGGYRPADYQVEPDASAASYLFAAAAICGGRVTVEGLGEGALQGDVGFVDVLARMGCTVERTATATTVRRSGPLDGVDVDMSDISDTAQTLAAVAVFARTPTRVRGIGFIRAKETDRVGNVVRELRRCGVDAEEEPDGFAVRPGAGLRPARVETYDDHRMAMSFALLGLRVPGIEIADPGCVAKTFPGYWDALAALRPGAGPGHDPGRGPAE